VGLLYAELVDGEEDLHLRDIAENKYFWVVADGFLG
jgi:hypothetical protein